MSNDLETTPFEVLDRRYTNLNIALDESSKALTVSRGETVTRGDIENGLVLVLGLEEIYDVLKRDINSAEIIDLLRDCEFARLRTKTLCQIVLNGSILPPDVPLHLEEAKVRFRGEQWEIHKYDADPFPSNPHGHNYRQT